MNSIDNPLVKYAEVTIGTVVYKLVYDFRAIALAERKIPNLNLLTVFQRLNELTSNEFLALLWAALSKFHPTLTLDAVADLVSIPNMETLLDALVRAYVVSLPEKKDVEATEEESPLEVKPNSIS